MGVSLDALINLHMHGAWVVAAASPDLSGLWGMCASEPSACALT